MILCCDGCVVELLEGEDSLLLLTSSKANGKYSSKITNFNKETMDKMQPYQLSCKIRYTVFLPSFGECNLNALQ